MRRVIETSFFVRYNNCYIIFQVHDYVKFFTKKTFVSLPTQSEAEAYVCQIDWLSEALDSTKIDK